MNKLIKLLLAMPLLFVACSNDEDVAGEESVQVNFCTMLPGHSATRAGSALTVDKVVCAVFENGAEIGNLRQVVDVTASGPIVFAPQLIKGHTYSIVFWAMKEGCYNVTNMTAITRNAGAAASEADFEAFTESVSIAVTGTETKSITLKRPYAQLNLGVTADDWNAVAGTFNLTPKKMVIKTTAKDAFDALAGTPTGDAAEITRTLTVTGSDLTVDANTYKSLASCYVYPDAGQSLVNVSYTVATEDDVVIRQDVVIQNVPLQANYRTNIVGGLLTGTVTYTIAFEENFTQSNNSEI